MGEISLRAYIPPGHEGHLVTISINKPPHCDTCDLDIGRIMELKRTPPPPPRPSWLRRLRRI